MIATEPLREKPHVGGSDFVPATSRRPLFPLAADSHRLPGLDSPQLAKEALVSVHALLDSNQSRQNLQLTTAWGEPLPGFSSSQSVQDRHGFTSRERDGESSLMHFRARSYDPRLGRFVQVDPVLENKPFEHYIYAGNNPTAARDPSGRTAEWLAAQEKGKKFTTGNRKYVTVAETQTEIRIGVRFVVDAGANANKANATAFLTQFAGAEKLWNKQSHEFTARDGRPKIVRFSFDATAINSKAGDPIPFDRYRFSLETPAARRGARVASAGTLYTDNKAEDVGHEIGHVGGLDEDYRRGAGGRAVATRNTIMGASGARPEIRAYHIATWLLNYYEPLAEGDFERRRMVVTAFRILGQAETRRSLGHDAAQAKEIERVLKFMKDSGIKELQPQPPQRDE